MGWKAEQSDQCRKTPVKLNERSHVELDQHCEGSRFDGYGKRVNHRGLAQLPDHGRPSVFSSSSTFRKRIVPTTSLILSEHRIGIGPT